jgi:hypothetical protein
LDGKYKTTSFFGVKLLKCPFEKKINLKMSPKNGVILKKKKKKEKKKKERKKEEEEERWGSLACSLGETG